MSDQVATEMAVDLTGIHRPMVSVGMLTYNHEKFIARALDSILMQEVNFDYEIVVSDDCSTDRTREIILEYQKRYPGIVKPRFNETNLGGQKNANALRTACIGKYRATLEGDDYWITTTKLQRQVDFLESHPDYVAIGGDFSCVDDNGIPCKFPWGDIKYTYCQGDEYTMADLNNWLLPAHASCMCFRNLFVEITKEELDYFHSLDVLGDRRTSMYLLMHGKIKHQNEVLMIRRVLTQSKTSMTNLTKQTNWHARNYLWMLETERCVRDHFGRKDLDLTPFKQTRWTSSVKVFLTNPTISNLKLMKYIYKRSNQKRVYRKLFMGQLIDNAYTTVINIGTLRACVMGIKKTLVMFKRLVLCSSSRRKAEIELYEKSLGKQFM